MRRYSLTFVILLLTANLPTIAAFASGRQSFFFFVLADPQFGMYTHNKGFAQETKNLEIVIAAANRLHPAFVIVCGDLVNQPENATELDGFQQVVRRLDPTIPFYDVAGNHDVGNVPTPSMPRSYRETSGPDYYTFRINELEGVVLDSQLIKNGSKDPAAAKAQKTWLEARLAKAKAQNIRLLVVFQHIPWFLRNANEKDNYFNIPLQARLKYLKRFHHFGVRYVFAGHYHRNAHGTYQGVNVVTIGPVGKPLGKDPSGFEIVEVKNNDLSYRYVPFGSAGEITKPIQ